MIIKQTKDCEMEITERDNKYYLLISREDGYHCECAELTKKQTKKLVNFINKTLGE